MFCGYFQSEPQRWYLRTSVRECSPLSAWPKKCGCFFPQEAPKVCCVTVTGLEDQIFQILLLSVVVSGKGNCCNSCQSAFPGAGKKPKLPVREWKGWLLFSPLFFFSPDWHSFFLFCRYQKFCLPSERYKYWDSQDVRSTVLWVAFFFSIFL